MAVDIDKLEALHAASTQNEWLAKQYEGMTDKWLVNPEIILADWRFCCASHNEMPEILAELRLLREFEKQIRDDDDGPVRFGDASDVIECATGWLDEQRKAK